MRPISEIIVHCTATRADWWQGKPTSEKVEEIRRWHVDGNGWSDIGYHFLIDRDGTVAKGRDVSVTGAHVRGKNTGTIGISLFGGHGSSETDEFSDHFTRQQEGALIDLIDRLMDQHQGISTISGHNQYAAKACPGFSVPAWWADVAGIERPPERSGVLRMGDRGPEVKLLQMALADLGYHSGRVDGIFGRLVRGAVLSLQADNDLATDGIVGPDTQRALKSASPRPERDVTEDDLQDSKTLAGLDRTDRGADVAAVVATGGAIVDEWSGVLDTAQRSIEAGEGFLERMTDIIAAHWPTLVFILAIVVVFLIIRGNTKQTRLRRIEDARSGRNMGR